jgi:predicted PolB exonuclease-like 3'-5' exonuclease
MTILVFDIETVPDVEAGRKLYDLHDLSDADVAKAMYALRRAKVGHDFIAHYLHKIVAISLVLSQDSQLKVWSLGNEASTEKDLINRFFSGIEKYTPTLVSWNGGGFDLPVLHYRALFHGIKAPLYWETGDNQQAFRWNNYLNRFHYRHLDLMDVLSGYQMKAAAPLDDIAGLLGFPGKMGMSGANVWKYYLAGKGRDIRQYCETDVLNTYCVYLRFEQMRGTLSDTNYQQALTSLITYLKHHTEKPHFQQFLMNMTELSDDFVN